MRRRENQTPEAGVPGLGLQPEFARLYKGRRYEDWPGLEQADEPVFDEIGSILAGYGSLMGSAAEMCAQLGDSSDGGSNR